MEWLMAAECTRGGKRIQRGRVTRGSTWFWGEGKVETLTVARWQLEGRRRWEPQRQPHEAEASHRCPRMGLGRHHSLAHQASARL